MPKQRKKTPVEVRFRKHFDEGEPNECWPWKGGCLGQGHPQIHVDSKTLVLAHRLSYQIANGSIPSGMVIRHMCNNPKCVNPAHLKAGTVADNSRDMVRAGTNYRGGSRMSESMQNAIDEAMQGGIPMQIARKWGVHSSDLYRHLNKRKAREVAS